MMSDTSSQCTRPSDRDVSENMVALLGRLPLEILLILDHYTSDTSPKTELSRDSHPSIVLPHNPLKISLVYRLALPLVPIAWVGPACHAGYAGQKRAGNGPERSASGGCNPGADGLGAFDPLEKGCTHLRPGRWRRKRGSDPPQPSRASSKRGGTARTFACHFYLHDRIGHSACLNVRLARLSDVRQHLLERTHKQIVHCPVCGTSFPGRLTEARRQRDAHVQAATCERSSSPFNYPGITEDEDRQIREIARNTRTADYTEHRRWFMIWDVLFPGEQRPASPFLTDVPDIQRVFDWAYVIFSDSDRWLTLPNEPWTPAMSREQRNARMSNFIESFIIEARDLVGEDSGPVEDEQGADNSYVNVASPDPSSANLGVASVASFDSSRPADASGRLYLDPGSATGSRQAPDSQTLGAMGPSTSEQPAQIPFRPLNEPAVDVAQDIQQHAAPGPAFSLDDPALPPLDFQDSPADNPAINIGFDWFNSITINAWEDFRNDEAGPADNYTPPDEDELGGHH